MGTSFASAIAARYVRTTAVLLADFLAVPSGSSAHFMEELVRMEAEVAKVDGGDGLLRAFLVPSLRIDSVSTREVFAERPVRGEFTKAVLRDHSAAWDQYGGWSGSQEQYVPVVSRIRTLPCD